jgi:hypothetical protein
MATSAGGTPPPPPAAPPPGPNVGGGARKIGLSAEPEALKTAAPEQRVATDRREPSFEAPGRIREESPGRPAPTERPAATAPTRPEQEPKPPTRSVGDALNRETVRNFVRARPVMTIDEERGAREAWRRGDDQQVQRIRQRAAQRVQRDVAAVDKATPVQLAELAGVLKQPGGADTRARFRTLLDEVGSRDPASRTAEPAGRPATKQSPAEEIGRIVGVPRERATERDDPKSTAFWQPKPGQQTQQRWLSEMAQDGNRFMNRGQLSFVDQGKSIVAYESSTPAVRAMLDLASTKDWRGLKVEGRPEFQRAVFLEARARGIEIQTATWKPSREDLEPTLGRSASPTSSRAAESTPAAQRPTERAATTTSEASRDAEAPARAVKLLQSGMAPYEFKEGKTPSFYVRTEGQDGQQRVTWGKDLQRALERADARPGDRIQLDRVGGQDVRVKTNVRDAYGREEARDVRAQRGEWTVSVVERGSRETPQSGPQAALEKVLRSGNYTQGAIDQVLKAAKAEEANRTARGDRFEVRAFDPSAARTTPAPTIAPARAQTEQTRSR